MESTFKRMVTEVVLILIAVVGILYVNFTVGAKDRIKHHLMECDGITPCTDVGVFYNEDICNDMRDKLNSEVKIFTYACDRSPK